MRSNNELDLSTATTLTLTRRNGESLHVDGPCVVTILRDGGGRTRLQVTAAPQTKILRSELIREEAKPE
jgi:sRNA-binding carbon storage regulator CsrA